jgi:hypothetical protein
MLELWSNCYEILASDRRRDAAEAPRSLRSNGFAYTLDRTNGALIVAEKYDPAVNWATKVDMDKASQTYGRPIADPKYPTQREGTNVKGICPGCAWNQGSTACRILTLYWPVLRADEPRLHGLRAVQGELHGRAALCWGKRTLGVLQDVTRCSDVVPKALATVVGTRQ